MIFATIIAFLVGGSVGFFVGVLMSIQKGEEDV